MNSLFIKRLQIIDMNVVSFFDGISCGQIALNRFGVPYHKYFASEIDVRAIQTTQYNYFDTIQIGCIKKVKSDMLPTIDLLLGGSPCQGFSISGKRLNFEHPKSKLFFEFVRLKNELNPTYFLLENVPMKKQYQDVISYYLGVEPIVVNSSLVSAQNRVRLYWTNITGFKMPADKNIILADILENNKMVYPAAIRGRQLHKKSKDIAKRKLYTQCLEVKRQNTNKSNCLTTVAKDNVLTSIPSGKYPNPDKTGLPYRHYTIKELARLQNIPINYFPQNISDSHVRKMIGNSWTVDVIGAFLKPLAIQSKNIFPQMVYSQ